MKESLIPGWATHYKATSVLLTGFKIEFVDFSRGSINPDYTHLSHLYGELWPRSDRIMPGKALPPIKLLTDPDLKSPWIKHLAKKMDKEAFCEIMVGVMQDYLDAAKNKDNAVGSLKELSFIAKEFADIEERRGTMIDTKA